MDDIEAKIVATLKQTFNLFIIHPHINKHIKILKQFWIVTWKTYKASPFHKSIENFYNL